MRFYATSKISENLYETPEGFLVCPGVAIARTGEMVYGPRETPLTPGEDGRVVVDRDEEEVFRPETIASFEGKPITIQHPEEFVDPQNWKDLAKGVLQNVRRGEGGQSNDLIADLLITDSVAIDLVKSGLREVSCGYEAEYVETGVGKGKQKNIIGNHLALVYEGRAGSAYAIKDHKGRFTMKLKEKIKSIFAKAQDEALQAAEDAPEEMAKKPEGSEMYDELMKAVKDLGEKVAAFAPKKEEKDASTQPTESTPAEVVAKDEEVAPGLEERLAKLEAMVAKLVGAESKEVGDDEEVEAEEMGDEKEDEEKSEDAKGCDEKEDEKEMTGDAASRVEILAPGMSPEGKEFKAKALKIAYGTTDGKAVIDAFTSGQAPDLKNKQIVEMLFIAASELLKERRAASFARTQVGDMASHGKVGEMTPEKLNEVYAKYWANK
jgi:hypothetical protein